MTRYSKVKVLRFEGYGAEKKCEQAINQGIDKGWQPIDVTSYVPPDSRNLRVIAFMGKLEKGASDESKEGEEDIEETETDKTEEKKEIRECPRCENEALEVKDDHSAYCDYCGYIIDDIREISQEGTGKQEEEGDSSQKQVF